MSQFDVNLLIIIQVFFCWARSEQKLREWQPKLFGNDRIIWIFAGQIARVHQMIWDSSIPRISHSIIGNFHNGVIAFVVMDYPISDDPARMLCDDSFLLSPLHNISSSNSTRYQKEISKHESRKFKYFIHHVNTMIFPPSDLRLCSPLPCILSRKSNIFDEKKGRIWFIFSSLNIPYLLTRTFHEHKISNCMWVWVYFTDPLLYKTSHSIPHYSELRLLLLL